MSKIKVNEIEAQSGSTITIPTGQNLVVTDGLATSSLPTVPVTKGGTGLTSLGTANQVVAVNSGASALEFQDASSGKIGQVVSTTKTDAFSTSIGGGGEASITGLSVSITPSATSSKILVWYSVQTAQNTGAWQYALVKRGTTKIGVGDQIGSSRNRVSTFGYHGDNGTGDANNNQAFQVLDEPNTTSATTYQVFVVNGSGSSNTFYVNSNTSSDTTSRATFASTITAMEILA